MSQHSGVSVRLSVTNQETLAAAAIRRALRHGETEAVPRVSDLGALVSSTLGKLEIESLEEGEDEEVVDKLIKAAVLQTFREHCPPETLGQVVGGFEDGKVVHAGPDLVVGGLRPHPRGTSWHPYACHGAQREIREPGRDRQRRRARARRASTCPSVSTRTRQGRGRPTGRDRAATWRTSSYSRWDGTQAGFDLDADAILSEIKDDLMYHGDIGSALRRLLQQGFQDRNGRHVEGMQELLERIRERRRQEREQHDLGGVYEDIANELNEILDQERQELDQLEQEARDSGDERRREVTESVVGERRARARAAP